MIPLPTIPGGFRAVVADPPWTFGDHLPGPGRGAAKHYRTMTTRDIALMGPELWDVIDPAGCHLWLWVTNSHVEAGYEVMRAWGFDPKTTCTWVKMTNDGRALRMGMGRYLRGATEHLLFGVRGRLPVLRNDLLNVIMAPRGIHSAKPEASYQLIREASPGPRLELFSRTVRDGFIGWGDEYQEGEIT